MSPSFFAFLPNFRVVFDSTGLGKEGLGKSFGGLKKGRKRWWADCSCEVAKERIT